MGKILSYLAAVVVVVMFSLPVVAADKEKKGHHMDAEARFKMLDTNGDGKLSVEEFVGKAEGKRAEAMKKHFAKLDTDGDGSLSLDEFKAGMQHHGKKHEKPADNGDNK